MSCNRVFDRVNSPGQPGPGSTRRAKPCFKTIFISMMENDPTLEELLMKHQDVFNEPKRLPSQRA